MRTLGALHLASLDYLRCQRLARRLASYEERMLGAAKRMRLALYPLDSRGSSA